MPKKSTLKKKSYSKQRIEQDNKLIVVKDGRARNYATVVYADSAPSDWKNILSEYKIPAFISPYHDKDINPTGEPKKPHWHVMIMFDNVKNPEQVQVILDSICGVGLETVASIRGYARYLCHLDNPEKAQYPTEEVQALAGADYLSIIQLAIDKYKGVCEMQDFCDKNNIVSFAHLMQYARIHRYDWFRLLVDSCTFVMSNYLKSKMFSIEKGISKTGTFLVPDGDGVMSEHEMPVDWWQIKLEELEEIPK